MTAEVAEQQSPELHHSHRDVTRTITATGETFEHLSESDRGAVPSTERPA